MVPEHLVSTHTIEYDVMSGRTQFLLDRTRTNRFFIEVSACILQPVVYCH